MLQKEFEERIGRSVTQEEYVAANAMYMAAGEMDKDEFCKLWLKNRENKIIAEMMATIKKLENDCEFLKTQNTEFLKEKENLKETMESELKDLSDTYKRHMEEFGRKMVIHFEDESYRYDDICEEFGLNNVCKWKLEEGIDLEKEEREHLIKKL